MVLVSLRKANFLCPADVGPQGSLTHGTVVTLPAQVNLSKKRVTNHTMARTRGPGPGGEQTPADRQAKRQSEMC